MWGSILFNPLFSQLGRIVRMWPFGDFLHRLFLPFLNSVDSGPAVVSYIYLLLGFSLPLWLYPLNTYNSGKLFGCALWRNRIQDVVMDLYSWAGGIELP